MRKNEISFGNKSFFEAPFQEAIKRSDRKKLILGRHINQYEGGKRLGKIAYHVPSPYPSHTEAIYVKGPAGSGKTWVAYSLAQQSFFAENRTWIIIDTKRSHIGNNRPNLEYYDVIKTYGARPRGIPGTQIDVISPQYYVEMQNDPSEIERTLITHVYKVPLRLCSLQIMFELTKMNRKAGYAATFDQTFKRILSEKKSPTIGDLILEFDKISQQPEYRIVQNIFRLMIGKIKSFGKQMIEDGVSWSSLGECLFKAARERRARWIVFTLALGDRPEDDTNLAMITAIITELRMFSAYARIMNLPIRLGFLLDELHAFVRNKDASARMAVHDLLYLWGRTSRVLRMFLTQNDKQVDKIFQDEIKPDSMVGAYQVLAETRALPIPGTLSYINRLRASEKNPYMPTYYANVMSMPPWAEVESDIPDDKLWIKKQRDRFFKQKEMMERNRRIYSPDPRLMLNQNILSRL